MKKGKFVLLIMFFAVLPFVLTADITGLKDEIDLLIEEKSYQDAIDILENRLSSLPEKEKSVACHLLSRLYLYLGDTYIDSNQNVNKILATFNTGADYGNKAVSYDKNNYMGYYWKASNIGKWGQTKGILDSLFKAGEMKDNLHKALSINSGHALSYYVLGMLFEQVPGFPVSFGNVDFSVSLGRKSIDAMERELKNGEREEINLDFYVQLAQHLYARNWNAGHRRGQMRHKEGEYNRKRDVLEKAFFYEGTVDIPNTSDRDEAVEIIRFVFNELDKDSENNEEKLEKTVKELLEAWTK